MVTSNLMPATMSDEIGDSLHGMGAVRFLFVGRKTASGEPVDGFIDAENEAGVVAVLAREGIVASRIRQEPTAKKRTEKADKAEKAEKPAAPAAALAAATPALTGGTAAPQPLPLNLPQTAREQDHAAVVLDRDKIRRNVAAALDHALALSFARGESAMQIRARVANAIHGLFKDYRNITSPEPVDHSATMEGHLARLHEVIQRTEKMLTNWSKMGPPRGGYSEGGGGKRRSSKSKVRMTDDTVLKEIFQANLSLMKSIEAGLTGGKL